MMKKEVPSLKNEGNPTVTATKANRKKRRRESNRHRMPKEKKKKNNLSNPGYPIRKSAAT